MTSPRAESSCRRARPAGWPLLDIRTADARVVVHPPGGGCTSSTDRDCGATDSVGSARFAVAGDSICDPSDAGRGAAKAKTRERRTAAEKKMSPRGAGWDRPKGYQCSLHPCRKKGMKFATGTISRRRSSYGTARTDCQRRATAVEHPALRSAGQLAVVPTSPARDTTPAARRRLSSGHEASRRVPASRLPWCLEGGPRATV